MAAESIAVKCPHCSATYSIGESEGGKTTACRKCKNPFYVAAPARPERIVTVEAAQPAAPEEPAVQTRTVILEGHGITVEVRPDGMTASGGEETEREEAKKFVVYAMTRLMVPWCELQVAENWKLAGRLFDEWLYNSEYRKAAEGPRGEARSTVGQRRVLAEIGVPEAKARSLTMREASDMICELNLKRMLDDAHSDEDWPEEEDDDGDEDEDEEGEDVRRAALGYRPTVSVTCPQCRAEFEADVTAQGRAECPKCSTPVHVSAGDTPRPAATAYGFPSHRGVVEVGLGIGGNAAAHGQRVRITGLDIPFGDMVGFAFKAILALIVGGACVFFAFLPLWLALLSLLGSL